MKRRNLVSVSLIAALVALSGCTTSAQVSAGKGLQTDTTRKIVGTDLVGAKGATPRDQDKIDSTAAGLCGARVWTPSECKRHTAETQ